jgi:hypothetical protein
VTRFRAAAIHAAISGIVASAVFLLNYSVWYPDALFEQGGGRQLFLLIAGVDVAIGPLITLIIFVPGKKGLAFDLATIAVLQLAALSYGAWVLFESRPVYIVFVKDRFELVRANAIADEELAKARSPAFAVLPWTGPRPAGVRIPKDPDEQFKLMMSAMSGGADIQDFPKYYVAYDEVRNEVLARAKPLSRLRELNPQSAAEIDRLVAGTGRTEAGLRFLPMRAGPTVDLAVVVDAARADILNIAALRPWEYK